MSSESELIGALLKEFRQQSMDTMFVDMIAREMSIPQGSRSRASDSQNALRDFLIGRNKADNSFPRILTTNGKNFMGGSFARHTKTWPLDDIDLYFPIDGNNLFYIAANGLRLPFAVITDGILTGNPLLTPKWMDGNNISSDKLVFEFSEILKDHYPNSDVKPNGQAVSVRLKQGETKHEDGLGYDVVPCFYLKPDDTSQASFYLMSNGSNGWIRTNPEIDTFYADKLHTDNNETYRSVVKCIKFWNKNRFQGKLKSYYLELAVMRAYLQENRNGKFIHKISHGTALGFWALNEALKIGDQQAFISEAPSVSSGILLAADKAQVATTFSTANTAWDAEISSNSNEAIRNWKLVFGDTFSR